MENLKYLESLKQQAIQSASGTYFNPERVGLQTLDYYDKQLEGLIEKIKDAEYRDYVIQKYKSLVSAYFHSSSRCVSWFISGPSNYPVRRQEKYRNWAENKRNAISDFVLRTEKRLNWKGKETIDESIFRLEEEIQDEKDNLELMKKANKFLKENKSLSKSELKEDFQIAFDFTDETVNKLFDSKFYGMRFQTFTLTNCRMRIKGKESTLEKYKKRLASVGEDQILHEDKDIKIVDSISDDRIKLFFSSIPPKSIRVCLVSNNFRWAPSESCWKCYRSISYHKFNDVMKELNVDYKK